MNGKFDLEEFLKDLDNTLEKGRKAFTGKYKDQLKALSGLSSEEINEISPEITSLQIYDELITVVKEASRVNLEQTVLAEQIKKLGEVAVSIAKRVPTLATIL
jgi:ClpP class serine protease